MFGTLLPRLQPARYGTLAVLFFASAVHAADWIVLRGAGVELVSDASEKPARQALQSLAEIQSLLPSTPGPDAVPLRIFLFAKESEYRAYAPDKTVSGFYQSGTERDYIVMHAGGGMPRVVSHEYIHFVTHQRGQIRPAWLEEGLAEFYSNFDGRQIGAPIPEHLKLLEKPWLTADEMNRPSRNLDQMFYAQSWALVHMLRREAQFPDRITPQMLVELRPYVKAMKATPVKLPATATPIAPVEQVDTLSALLLRADLALHSQKPELAKMLYTQAAREFPNSSAAATGLATVTFAEGSHDRALAQLKHALELNDRDALAWFELALMDNDQAALERAVQLGPNLADAQVLLGVRATDIGDLDTALVLLERATRLMPRKSYAWYSLGYAQQKGGDTAGAHISLEHALQTATSREQREMAGTLLDSLERK